jgi:hypothetical protein
VAVGLRPASDLFGPGLFWGALSQTAGLGTRTITGKKRDNLRNSSAILVAGMAARSSSRKTAELEFGSLSSCRKGEIADLIVAAIRGPPCLPSVSFALEHRSCTIRKYRQSAWGLESRYGAKGSIHAVDAASMPLAALPAMRVSRP